ncbi:oxidoreductasealdo/keto reductase family protein [Aphelenchoides avenae]|nr:oxidoreductasealdo/keto reductase family protein [Aphelenchus avenae]
MSTLQGGPRIKLNTGLEMPLVGFGTYKIRSQEEMDVAVDAALASGYRHVDTARMYANEAELGNSLEKLLPKHGLKREDVFLTTKYAPPEDGADEKLPQYMQESLDKLKTSYVDLVLIHYPKADSRDDKDPKNAENRRDTWLALEKLQGKGLSRSIGVSNYEVRHMAEIPKYSSTVPAVNQVEYHPHFRREDIRAYCDRHGIFFQAFSSLGRHHPDLVGDAVIAELAEKYKTSPQNVLLSFATSQNVGIVPKSTSPQRIRDNIDCLKLKLTQEELKKLHNIDKDQHYIRTTPWLVA